MELLDSSYVVNLKFDEIAWNVTFPSQVTQVVRSLLDRAPRFSNLMIRLRQRLLQWTCTDLPEGTLFYPAISVKVMAFISDLDLAPAVRALYSIRDLNGSQELGGLVLQDASGPR